MQDRDLAMAAARGDPEAIGTLAARYRRFIYAIAYRVLLNEEDALDAAQETLVKLASRIGQWDGRGALRSWLAAIAVREALSMRRRGWRESPSDPDTLSGAIDGGRTVAASSGSFPNALDRIENQERWQRVQGAMASLSPQQRAILTLRLAEELRPVQIAERLGLAPAQVRMQLSRAVARLRNLLAEGNSPPKQISTQPRHQKEGTPS